MSFLVDVFALPHVVAILQAKVTLEGSISGELFHLFSARSAARLLACLSA